MEKTWTPNPNQQKFLEVLANYPDGTTLKDIEIDTGLKVATGSINNAHMHELVDIADGEIIYDKMYRGVKVGEQKVKVKIYKLK